MIPKNILYFWHDYSVMPNVIAKAVQKTSEINGEYQVIKADDRLALDLIKNYGEKAYFLYKSIPIPAARSDIARLLLLQEYGGIYLDAAIEVTMPLSNLYQDNDEFVTLAIDHQQKDLKLTHVCNGLLGSVPQFDIVSELIETILDVLYSKRYNNEVWYTTGPFFLNLLLKKYNIKNIRQLRSSNLKGKSLIWRRFPGVSNSWTTTEKNGVVLDKFFLQYPESKGIVIDKLYETLLSDDEFISNPQSCNQLAMRFISEEKFEFAYSLLKKAKSSLNLWSGDLSQISEKIDQRLSFIETKLHI